jgi:predicted AAA+ superfamily ATPase
MFIPRKIGDAIRSKLITTNKILILYGPRQSGKTTLVESILKDIQLKQLKINADEKKYTDILSSRDLNKLKLLVENYDLLFIDEAQRIPDIGVNLKLLRDHLPGLKIIATGSSSFELANRVKEPLTGRTWTFSLYPIAFDELRRLHSPMELAGRLEEFLVYGMYPEALSIPNQQDRIIYLKELSSSYLYKDIFEISSIRHASRIDDLLRLLAFQIGGQVSIAELAQQLNLSRDTVTSYIDLLEKSFILFRLRGFSRNLRKEVVKMDKIYFYDLGIRNAIIDNFKSLNQRNDIGRLWENFIICERRKFLSGQFLYTNPYFWRTYTGAELDYVEESGEQLSGYEIKWTARKSRPPSSWSESYPHAGYSIINQDTFHNFISSADASPASES